MWERVLYKITGTLLMERDLGGESRSIEIWLLLIVVVKME